MAPVDDDADDSFSFHWGATPESQRQAERATRAYRALEQDDADEIRRLAAEEPGWIGGDVFHEAVRHGCIRCVAALIELGHSALVPDECAATPLMYAAQGDLALVRLLVEAGADPDALAEDFDPEIDADAHGRSALFWALLAGRADVAAYLEPLTHPDLRRRAREALKYYPRPDPEPPGPA